MGEKKEQNQGHMASAYKVNCLLIPHSSSRTLPSFASNSTTILIPFSDSSYTSVLLYLITEVLQEAPVNALGFLPKLCVVTPKG